MTEEEPLKKLELQTHYVILANLGAILVSPNRIMETSIAPDFTEYSVI